MGSLIVPFTPAHMVAALPFRRSRRLDMAALVVGCLSPDFEYFLRGEARGSFGHTLTGLIVLDLPLSLLVLWLYWRYVLRALHTAAPMLFPFAKTSQPKPTSERWLSRFTLVAVSILIGGATHIVWDSFTHPSFWPYRHIALLHRRFACTGGLEFYKVLQHASTVFGMCVLLFLWWRWVRSASDPNAPVLKPAAMFLILLAVVATALRLLLAIALQPARTGLPLLASRGVITLLDGLSLALVGYGVMLRRRSTI